MKVKSNLLLLFLLVGYSLRPAYGACSPFELPDSLVVFSAEKGTFPLSEEGKLIPICFSQKDFTGVDSVAHWLSNDLHHVAGRKTSVLTTKLPASGVVIIVGTIGKNEWIDQLIQKKKIDVSTIHGKWEAGLMQVVNHPFPGVAKALILAGSDRRGTMYMMLRLSAAAGVSPWYWWADVPVVKHKNVYVKDQRYINEGPKVKYRGLFLNDEAPALAGWAKEHFGGFNHKFYQHFFELLLRLGGNYFWPAMWGNAFFDDDPQNGPMAHALGVVIGTSHHEPLGRAHAEWKRYGKGPWNYQKNGSELRKFWTGGMERMKNDETIVTIGMRGDGDKAMSSKTNIALLERIVRDQRKIISQVTGKDASQTPQVWALYKEVQDYYDQGMRVPDDVTLLFSDDNWGDLRRLPAVDAPPRSGGYGIYYHFDYVGGPRNYKWINVTQIQRVWEQMNLADSHHVDHIWIANVGDLKPMEFPINFFMDMAWKPSQFNAGNLRQYTRDWCTVQFGAEYADEAARILDLYCRYNARVTPELLNSKTYSLDHYNEFKRVRDDYRKLALEAFRLGYQLPEKSKNAYDELVLFPVNASANLYEMYYAVAMNHQLAAANNPEANQWADEVQKCYDRDSLLTIHYNQQIAGGKWNHMMDQIHIGYTYWQEPAHRIMPKVFRIPKPVYYRIRMAFRESDGYVSIDAQNFQYARGNASIHWQVIPGLGKTGSAVAIFPAGVDPQPTDSVYLDYAVQFTTTGKVVVHVLCSPDLNFNGAKGLRYAISLDNGKEQIVNINKQFNSHQMENWQANRINETTTTNEVDRTGLHWLRIRMLDSGIVLQKIMIDTGGLKPSFLGAPQSKQIKL